MSLMVEKRTLVIPGQLIAEGDFVPGDNVYKRGDKIYSLRLGVFELVNKKPTVVPLKGFYFPRVGDIVIGQIKSVEVFGWIVEIYSPYSALLQSMDRNKYRRYEKETRKEIRVGDLIKAKIVASDRSRDPLLTIQEKGLGVISSGKVVRISPPKVPRLIGKEGSMINMLKEETSCKIFISHNGIVLVSGPSENEEKLALWAIKRIEAEAHTSGLTERISEDIRNARKKGDLNFES